MTRGKAQKLPNIDAFVEVFAVASVMATALYIAATSLIIKSKRAPLIFPEAGIAGTAFFSAKYEEQIQKAEEILRNHGVNRLSDGER